MSEGHFQEAARRAHSAWPMVGKPPRMRHRHLNTLGIDPAYVHRASRSRKGYWRMSQMQLVRHALNNRWLEEQGVPEVRAIWIKLHHGPDARV